MNSNLERNPNQNEAVNDLRRRQRITSTAVENAIIAFEYMGYHGKLAMPLESYEVTDQPESHMTSTASAAEAALYAQPTAEQAPGQEIASFHQETHTTATTNTDELLRDALGQARSIEEPLNGEEAHSNA